VVCPHCSSAIILDEKAASVSGKMAVLAQTPSPFFVGGSGSLQQRTFSVIGRVRYGYTRGFWDEWYLAFEDGRTVWVSEDEGNYAIEVLSEVDVAIEFATASPGDRVQLAGTEFHVDEKDVATCEGGEGQIPFRVLTGEKTPFLDLSTKDRFATIEFDLDDPTRVFLGKRLDLKNLKFDQTAEQAGARDRLGSERAASGEDRARIVKSGGRELSLNCFACAAPLPTPGAGAQTLQCTYCDAVLDLSLKRVECPGCGVAMPLSGGESSRTAVCRHCKSVLDVSRRDRPAVLEKIVATNRPKVPFALGQPCVFDDIEYRVIGHIRFVERDSWGTYRSDEFLIFNSEHGYRWLILEAGHFSMSDELDERPRSSIKRAPQKTRLSFAGRRWRVFESGTTTVEFVDGELPWVAETGDQNEYTDAISPPEMLSMEWTAGEAEWYRARYLWPEEVAAAFGVERSVLPRPLGVAPHQPYSRSSMPKLSTAIMTLFGLVYGLLGLWAWISPGHKVAEFRISPAQYESEFVTEPFEINGTNSLCRATFRSEVDNSWVYLDVAVLNDKEQALLDFSAEMSYYHGVEGGESWTEGSRDDAQVFKLAEPGQYNLFVLGQAGTGNQPAAIAGQAVHVTIFADTTLKRYYFTGAALCALYAFAALGHRSSFEKRRWGDDDDD
jgi:hypothetical protein